MRFGYFLSAALPSVWALPSSTLTYRAPSDLMSRVESNDDCDLPVNYTIQNFAASTNDTGSTLTAYDFRFVDKTTKISTLCHFNSTSTSTTPGTLNPRYACEYGEVKFMWYDAKLWMTERVCPGPDGKPDYEVSGSIKIPLTCDAGRCSSNSTELASVFTSIQPVRDPTRR